MHTLLSRFPFLFVEPRKNLSTNCYMFFVWIPAVSGLEFKSSVSKVGVYFQIKYVLLLWLIL